MLAAATPIGFILTRDPARAKAFYSDILGFRLTGEDDFAAVYDMAGLTVRLSTVEDHQAAAHPVLGWAVPDIAAAARGLLAKGVTFQIYPGFGQDDLGIWTAPDGSAKVNWFADPDGNLLSLTQTG